MWLIGHQSRVLALKLVPCFYQCGWQGKKLRYAIDKRLHNTDHIYSVWLDVDLGHRN